MNTLSRYFYYSGLMAAIYANAALIKGADSGAITLASLAIIFGVGAYLLDREGQK